MNVLVLGAGAYQVSGIKKLKEKGFFVVALDGNPASPGKEFANEFKQCNILSFEEVKDYILEKGEDFFDACLSFCTDAPMKVLGEINDFFGFMGISKKLAQISVDKFLQREKMVAAGLPTPAFQLLNSPDDLLNIEFPCVVKPVDSAGSRGVSVVWSKKEYDKAIINAFDTSKSGKCIVEEFIVGTEYTAEVLLHNGQQEILGISEKFKPLQNYTVSNQLHYNSPRAKRHYNQIASILKRFFETAHYDNSITHTELILNEKNNQFYLIESSLRSGGFAIFDEVLPYLSDDDIVGKTIDVYLGKEVELDIKKEKSVIMNFVSSNPGKLISYSMDGNVYSNFEGASEKHGFFLKEGDEVKALDSDGARVAFILTFADNWHKAFELSNLVEYSMNIDVERLE